MGLLPSGRALIDIYREGADQAAALGEDRVTLNIWRSSAANLRAGLTVAEVTSTLAIRRECGVDFDAQTSLNVKITYDSAADKWMLYIGGEKADAINFSTTNLGLGPDTTDNLYNWSILTVYANGKDTCEFLKNPVSTWKVDKNTANAQNFEIKNLVITDPAGAAVQDTTATAPATTTSAGTDAATTTASTAAPQTSDLSLAFAAAVIALTAVAASAVIYSRKRAKAE